MKKVCEKNGFLYKKTLKIHQNLWKPYTVALLISAVFVAIKEIV